MTDLAFILLTVAFFAAVALVARRAAAHEPAAHEPAPAVDPLGRRK
ncbi:hypothetical protein [Promicromonospora aerolata]|uniref:Uncharacterized protein n=1 Tax=Promicromonospora aerolata TaxID=195749 RepID=A0ABW4V981_9MICO